MKKIFLVCNLLFIIFTHSVNAGEFNFGLGFINLNMNHYRGSDQSISYNFPFPYVYYQGERLEADSAMINGKFYTSRFLTVKLSMNASPKVESKENTARIGMPELDYMIGLGPMAVIHLVDSSRFAMQFELAARKEFETDFAYTSEVGYSQAIYFTMRLKGQSRNDLSGELSLGQLYADKNLHAYYYDVSSQYATSERPIYESVSGTSGKTIIFFIKKGFGDLLVMPFLRYDDLSEAVFNNSPLVKQRHYLMSGVGLFYLFF